MVLIHTLKLKLRNTITGTFYLKSWKFDTLWIEYLNRINTSTHWENLEVLNILTSKT